jgi:hypothetical protein
MGATDNPRAKLTADYFLPNVANAVDMKPLAERRALRYWRIAFSIICLALFCAVCVMWWRSYRWLDACYCRYQQAGDICLFYSYRGGVHINLILDRVNVPLHFHSGPIIDTSQRPPDVSPISFQGYRVKPFNFNTVVMPYWFPVAFFAALAGLPWYGRYIRFGLRTLLILFTIVAAMLGYIVWALHSTVAG